MDLGQLGPYMGYRWVRADPRNTPGWTHPGNSGSATGKSGKTEKLFPARFAFSRLNQGTYRHGRGIHGSGLTQGSRWCHWKSGNPDPDRARAGKPVFPFCPIVAQPGHLQTSAGYLRIGLDLRIPTVPKNPDFRFRICRKSRKTEKTENSEIACDISNWSLWHAGSCRHIKIPKFQQNSGKKILRIFTSTLYCRKPCGR